MNLECSNFIEWKKFADPSSTATFLGINGLSAKVGKSMARPTSPRVLKLAHKEYPLSVLLVHHDVYTLQNYT